jgi:hypothetical protein
MKIANLHDASDPQAPRRIWQSSEARLPRKVFNRTYDHSAQETEIQADWNRSVYVQSHSGCTRTQSLAGANKRHQVIEEGREVVVVWSLVRRWAL